MEAWTRSKDPVVARVERWLDRMVGNRTQNAVLRERSYSGDDSGEINVDYAAEPDTESYNLFLCALSKGHAKKDELRRNYAERAEEVPHGMLAARDTDDHAVIPDTDSFNYVLRAYTRGRAGRYRKDHGPAPRHGAPAETVGRCDRGRSGCAYDDVVLYGYGRVGEARGTPGGSA